MKYSLSARILETKELSENLKAGIQLDFTQFAQLAADCGFDGVNLRPWQVNTETVSDSQITSMKKILDEKQLQVFVITGKIDAAFVKRAKLLQAQVIQALPDEENLSLIDSDMRMAMQMHTNGDFESISDCLESFSTKYRDPRAGIFPEPGNLQLVGEKFSEDMFIPVKERIFGWFFQSLVIEETGTSAITLKSGRKVHCRRVDAWENPQLDMALFAKAIKKCGRGNFFNINEPPRTDFDAGEFLQKTLNFIKENMGAE